MFRQFLLDEKDRDWLRIFWRENPEQELGTYRMRTVVYGTACAPYQAIRTLHQLASEIANTSPRAAHILRHNMYMDDALVGANTLHEALLARNELIETLKSAGMELDKWSANHPDLLEGLSTASNAVRVFSEDDVVATLGLQWNPRFLLLQSLATSTGLENYQESDALRDSSSIQPAGLARPGARNRQNTDPKTMDNRTRLGSGGPRRRQQPLEYAARSAYEPGEPADSTLAGHKLQFKILPARLRRRFFARLHR